MGDIFYVIKMMVITMALIAGMQIKIGEVTIEDHTLGWLKDSQWVDTLRSVARGTIKAAGSGIKMVNSTYKNEFASSGASERTTEVSADQSLFKIKRSDAYRRQMERERDEHEAQAEKEAELQEYGPMGDEID